jgi:hypothetical protein
MLFQGLNTHHWSMEGFLEKMETIGEDEMKLYDNIQMKYIGFTDTSSVLEEMLDSPRHFLEVSIKHPENEILLAVLRTQYPEILLPPKNYSNSSSCFVATVVFDNPNNYYVQVLRDWRDQHLSRYSFGRIFIGLYYKHGPAIALFVKQYDFLKSLIRKILVYFINHVILKTKE